MKRANRSNLNAIDHLGRELPHANEVRPRCEGKTVGMFYYLWHGYHGTEGPYDITKILCEDPNAMDDLNSPAWPDYSNVPMLHWGEPMLGYYLSTDEWVLRRHAQMFIDAGIDLLFFDVTNGFTYRRAYLKLFEVLTDLQKQGFEVPRVCFYLAPNTRGCGTGNMMDLWEQLYEPGLYRNLWYHWKGKPLIICHSHRAIPREIREFFTWRAPTWEAPKMPNCWAWEGNPQAVAVDENGEPEQIAVSVCANRCSLPPDDPMYGTSMSDAHWGSPVFGRSWHNGGKDTRENASHYGFFLQDQMDYAIEKDPPVAFLCQWNEWLVPFLTKRAIGAPQYNYHGHEICFRDEFNEEYSRDIEPMKGGYRDAYYLQTVAFVRRFKGMEPPVKETDMHTVAINGDFSQWDAVDMTYREYVGDCAPRDHRAYDAIGRYQNNTGRNEFSRLKVASDEEMLYFYAECTAPITAPAEANWMTLYLRNPNSTAPAWEGYQLAVNRRGFADDTAAVEACSEDGAYAWSEIARVPCICRESRIHLAIPKKLLDIADECFSIEFKWSDNMQEADVMDFYQNGDAAPRGRMNYVYYFTK